jgi:effector-binding domain-containing protein
LFVLVALVVTGFLLPKQVHVERSVTVDRPATMMFALLNSYRYYNRWSPWAARDPQAEFHISGPESGVGARLSWMGEPNLVGSGWQEIVASEPYELIEIRLDFDSQGVARSRFTLLAQGASTHITWSFDSDLTEGMGPLDAFLARYFGLLFDRWVGGDYEQGLANLKHFAESLPASDFSELEISRIDAVAQEILLVSTSSSQDPADIALAISAAYAEIGSFISENELEITGKPMAITRAWEEGSYEFDAAIPVSFIPERLPENIRAGRSPSGSAVRAIHRGKYNQMMPTYEKLAAYMTAHGLSQGSVSWEHYISDPAETSPEELITHVYVLIDD